MDSELPSNSGWRHSDKLPLRVEPVSNNASESDGRPASESKVCASTADFYRNVYVFCLRFYGAKATEETKECLD
jgi:hypothetical protein